MTKKLNNHLQYYWYVYLLSIVIIVIMWVSIFNNLAEPSETERLYISYYGSSLDVDTFENDIEENYSNYTSTTLKEISIDEINTGSNEYDLVMLATRAVGDFDVVIVEEKNMFEGIGSSYFLELDESALSEYINNLTFYKEDNVAYGINIGKDFSSSYLGDDDCYLFVCINTSNFASLNDNGSKDDDAIIALIKYLIR